MIRSGLARTNINQRVGRIVLAFKWGVENELVPPSIHHGLKAVAGLKKGRTEARETLPVRCVPEGLVDATRPHVARQVWAMIELQKLTGARPGEVVLMRSCDVDTSAETWVYSPMRHKTQHHGRQRFILLGPKAQGVLRPWLREAPQEFLFQPREAMAEYRRNQRLNRKTPLPRSRKEARPKPSPKKVLRERYSSRTYHHAVRYGCLRANVDLWHPNQLRHNVANRLRKEYGIEVARIILGHGELSTTQIYAEEDFTKATAVMSRFS